jgi:hypothetical protein
VLEIRAMAHDLIKLPECQPTWQTLRIRSEIPAYEWAKGSAPTKVSRDIDHCGLTEEGITSSKESVTDGMAAHTTPYTVHKVAA